MALWLCGLAMTDLESSADGPPEQPSAPRISKSTSGIVREHDPLLGQVDDYLDDHDKRHAHDHGLSDRAHIVLAWSVIVFLPTVYFALGVYIIIHLVTKHPFAVFSLIASLTILAILSAVLCRKRMWLVHAWFCCPFAALFGGFVGVLILCRGGSLSEFWYDARTYTNVNGAQAAAEFADAGIILFEQATKVDTSRGVGFMDKWTGQRYCVAPIIDDKMTVTDPVNFWAVGVDCCDLKVFTCGDIEYTQANPDTSQKSALVLPRSRDIAPISGLQDLVVNASRYERYEDALRLAMSRDGIQVASGAVLLRWTQNPIEKREVLWQDTLRSAFNAVICFAFFMAIVAMRIAPDVELKKQMFETFNPKHAFRFRKKQFT